MDKKKIRLILFILVVLVQIYIPAKMIWDKEQILDTGIEYKFKTAAIDPVDPFRGKYITLNYRENSVAVEDENDWVSGEKVYLLLATDNDGFTKIKSASKIKPLDKEAFLKTTVLYTSSNNSNKLRIEYPFDRFYMEESKAYDAERVFIESMRDTSKVTYALVNIKNGDAVLKDVMIDGTSIREIVKEKQLENKGN